MTAVRGSHQCYQWTFHDYIPLWQDKQSSKFLCSFSCRQGNIMAKDICKYSQKKLMGSYQNYESTSLTTNFNGRSIIESSSKKDKPVGIIVKDASWKRKYWSMKVGNQNWITKEPKKCQDCKETKKA